MKRSFGRKREVFEVEDVFEVLGSLGGLKCSKGSIRSMSSKGWGFSSADVGVFTNRQRE